MTADMLSLHLDPQVEKLRPRTNKNIPSFFSSGRVQEKEVGRVRQSRPEARPAVFSTSGHFTREDQFKVNNVNDHGAENRDQEFSVVSHFSNPIVLPQPPVTPTSY